MVPVRSLLILSLFSLFACQKEAYHMQSVHSAWEAKKELQIPFEVTQPGKKDLVLVIRNNDSYPYYNLFVFLEVPGVTKRDTLQYRLAEPNGKWIGTGYGPGKEAMFEYKKGLSFSKAGTYTLKVSHGMRQKTLVGIEDIGLLVREAK